MEELPQVPEIEIPELDPSDLIMAQAIFGSALHGNEKATRIINSHGPLLFASILYTLCEDYGKLDPDDPDAEYKPRATPMEAEQRAIGIIRGVAKAFARDHLDDLDEQADTDTEINPIL